MVINEDEMKNIFDTETILFTRNKNGIKIQVKGYILFWIIFITVLAVSTIYSNIPTYIAQYF